MVLLELLCCSCFSLVGELFEHVILHRTRTGLCSAQSIPALGLEVQNRTSTMACSSREHLLTFTHILNILGWLWESQPRELRVHSNNSLV